MKTISISEAKATLSQQLQTVRRGGEVLITDRGRPVARLVPATNAESELAELVSSGLLRNGSGRLPRSFWSAPRPADRAATVRAAVANEREDRW